VPADRLAARRLTRRWIGPLGGVGVERRPHVPQVERSGLRLGPDLTPSRDQVLEPPRRAALAEACVCRLPRESSLQRRRGNHSVRGRGRETHPDEEPLDAARTRQVHGVDLGRTGLVGGRARPGQERVAQAAAPGTDVDVERFHMQGDVQGEGPAFDDPCQQETRRDAVEHADQHLVAGSHQERGELLAKHLGIRAARIGDRGRLGPGRQAQPDQPLKVFRDRQPDLGTWTHVDESPLPRGVTTASRKVRLELPTPIAERLRPAL